MKGLARVYAILEPQSFASPPFLDARRRHTLHRARSIPHRSTRMPVTDGHYCGFFSRAVKIGAVYKNGYFTFARRASRTLACWIYARG